MKEMKNKAAPAAVSVPKCPFPCGWENLHKLAVAEGAFLANSLREDEPLTEHQRDTVMRVVNYSIEMARAALAATPVQDVVLPEPAIMPKGESAAAQLRAMATNYPAGHSWDKLDGKACIRGALEIEALRALMAQAATAAAPSHPAEGVPAVEQGEVLVTVSGFTGSGKSAIAGEIEILCRALGLQVEWPDGDSEKNMTHADWTEALEQYKPRVRIVEQNIPFASKKGLSK